MFSKENHFDENSKRHPGGPSPIYTYPAGPREGGKGEVNLPLGSGGQKGQDKDKKKREKEERKTGSTRRPVGRRIRDRLTQSIPKTLPNHPESIAN